MLCTNTGRVWAEDAITGVGGIVWYNIIYNRNSSVGMGMQYNHVKLLYSAFNCWCLTQILGRVWAEDAITGVGGIVWYNIIYNRNPSVDMGMQYNHVELFKIL